MTNGSYQLLLLNQCMACSYFGSGRLDDMTQLDVESFRRRSASIAVIVPRFGLLERPPLSLWSPHSLSQYHMLYLILNYIAGIILLPVSICCLYHSVAQLMVVSTQDFPLLSLHNPAAVLLHLVHSRLPIGGTHLADN